MTQLNHNAIMQNLKAKIGSGTLTDAVKSVLQTILNEYMELERDAYIQAAQYERNATRTSMRNGYYERHFLFPFGDFTLRVPRTRDGKFSSEIFQKYARADQALLAMMMEMVVQGVSTRKVTQVVEKVCGKSVSKSMISKLMERLDPELKGWAERDLSGKQYPFLFVDAMYVKVREDRRVVSKALYIAAALTSSHRFEVIGFQVTDVESEDTWGEFFRSLKDRGMPTPQLVISDANAGLMKAVAKEFQGTSWQRCLFHFMQNLLSRLTRKGMGYVIEDVRSIFKAESAEESRLRLNYVLKKYEGDARLGRMLTLLEDDYDEVTQFYAFHQHMHTALKTTNAIERLNQEVRRREKVVRVFPNRESAFRLLGAILMDKNDKFMNSPKTVVYDQDHALC